LRDAASEILNERQRIQRGFGGAIAVSIVFHVVVAVGLVFAPRPGPDSHLRRPVVVKLSSFGRADDRVLTPRATSRPAPAKKPAIETPTAAPPPKPVEKTKSRQDLPRSRDAEKETVHKSVFGASPRKIEAPEGAKSARPAAEPPAAAPARSPGLSLGEPAIGSAGVTGLEGGDFPYTIYIERMLDLIGKRWFRPDIGGAPKTQIYFVIQRDGSVGDARVETSSGSSVFDRAALRAVVEASPLPPLPFAYQGTYLGVHLTFH